MVSYAEGALKDGRDEENENSHNQLRSGDGIRVEEEKISIGEGDQVTPESVSVEEKVEAVSERENTVSHS